jgi:nucleotide-binding universal stress UspA family protein
LFRRVLLCYDGTAAGRRALRRGAELAILLNSDVHVLSIREANSPSAAVVAGASGHACLIDESEEDRSWVRCCIFVAHSPEIRMANSFTRTQTAPDGVPLLGQ